MAKRSADNQYREVRRGILSGDSTEFSLESILAEFRDVYASEEAQMSHSSPEEELPPEEVPAEIVAEEYEDEYDEEYAEEYEDEYEPEYEEEYAEEYPEEYEAGYEDEGYEPEYPEEEYSEELYPEEEEYPDDEDVKIYTPEEEHWELSADEDVKIYGEDPEEEELTEDDPELTLVLRFDEADQPLEESVEGYEDDGDFYAGPVDEEAQEETEPEEEQPVKRRFSAKSVEMGQLFQRLRMALAMASGKRMPGDARIVEPEDMGREMPPKNAAKFYAVQMQSLRLRALAGCGVCLLLVWVSFAYGRGWSMPGGLENDIKLASMFCVVALITVMLLALDVVTAGIMAAVRGKPSGESLIVLACLASVADAIAAVVTNGGGRGLCYAVVPAVALVTALWAGWHNCRGFKHSFLALHHARDPYTVSCEQIPERENAYLIKARRSIDGFIRRSEEPNVGEMLSAAAAPWLTVLALVFSLMVILVRKEPGAFFHVFAMMTAVSVSFLWLPAFPLFFSRTARHLMMNGSAIAGWPGVCEIGGGRHLILTDTDVFPDGTVELVGVRFSDKSRAETVVSVTGSLLSAAGVGLASVFTELMRRSDTTMHTVEEFTAGEGGITATVEEMEVMLGSAGFMHLNGIKIPSKMKQDDALYTAIDGRLEGVFLLNYRVSAGVYNALHSLRRGRRKPVFAMRDFNIDPMLIHRKFNVSSEGFEFPSVPERYRISGVPANSEGFAAAVMARDGLDMLVEVSEYGVRMYTYSRICAVAALISALAGMILLLIPGIVGLWAVASAANVLVYMLVWLLPMFLMLLDLKK